jgi:imidazolonepropionase-like amidohydrolase
MRVGLLLLGLGLTGAVLQAQPFERILLHCGTVIDPGVSPQPMRERTLIIRGERIEAVEAGFITPHAADQVVDLRAAYCLPGLIDMHTHLSFESRKAGYLDRFQQSPALQALQASVYAYRTLMAGFTTVRDLGGSEGIDLALRDAINRGWIWGPRMFVAGKSLAVTGGHADPTNGFREDILGVPTEAQGVVDGVESARRGARLAIKRGADVIKITATGGVLSIARDGSSPQFAEDEIRAIVEVARDFGLKVAAHAHGDEGMQRAIRAGVASIEHGTFMSEATMRLMKEKGVYLVPTLTAGRSVADSAQIPDYYLPVVAEKARRIGPVMQETFARAYRMGVPIAFGTDAGVFRHGRNALEFVYMVEAGMPPLEAIKAATYNAADLLGQLNNLGTLEPGKWADVIAVLRNPLEDIAALQEVEFVMKAGVIYKQHGQPLPRP